MSTPITTEDTPFEIGKAYTYWTAKDDKPQVGIIATGALLHKALKVADELSKEGIEIEVLNVITIKPLDVEAVVALAKKAGKLVTLEEHQIVGGLGGVIAETVTEHFPVKVIRIGVNDRFGQSGTSAELIEYYGMGEKDIKDAVLKLI